MITKEEKAVAVLKAYKTNMETPSFKCVYTKNEVLEALETVINRMENPFVDTIDEDDEDY